MPEEYIQVVKNSFIRIRADNRAAYRFLLCPYLLEGAEPSIAVCETQLIQPTLVGQVYSSKSQALGGKHSIRDNGEKKDGRNTYLM